MASSEAALEVKPDEAVKRKEPSETEDHNQSQKKPKTLLEDGDAPVKEEHLFPLDLIIELRKQLKAKQEAEGTMEAFLEVRKQLVVFRNCSQGDNAEA